MKTKLIYCPVYFWLGIRKQDLDEALLDFIVKDSLPFTVVSDPGFLPWWLNWIPHTFFHQGRLLKPWWRGAIWKKRGRLRQEVENVSLTADMWTRWQVYWIETINMLSLSSLLDPRFKTFRFPCLTNAKTAKCRLISECLAFLRHAQQEEKFK